MRSGSMSKKGRPRMYHGVHNIWRKSLRKWCSRQTTSSLRLSTLTAGHLMYISMKWKTTSFKIGKKDTFTFTSHHKYSPETTSKFRSFQESTITCTVHCMPPISFRLQELPSHFLITLWVSTLSREWDSGILLKRPLDKIFTPLKRPFGRLKEKLLLFQFMHHSINWTWKLEPGIVQILKQDSGRLKDTQEALEMSPTHSHDFSDNLSTSKHSGCQSLYFNYFSCQASCLGFSFHWLIRPKFFTFIRRPLQNWFQKKPSDGCLISWQLEAF